MQMKIQPQILFLLLSAFFLASCAKRYQLGTLPVVPIAEMGTVNKRATLLLDETKLKDRYEDKSAGLDIEGTQEKLLGLIEDLLGKSFRSFQVNSSQQMMDTQSDILLVPELKIAVTEDGPLAKDLVIDFSLKAEDSSGKLITKRNMEKRVHYATTTKDEIELSLSQVTSEVVQDIYHDLHRMR